MISLYLKKDESSLSAYELHYLSTMITLSRNINNGIDKQIIDAIINQMIGYLQAGLITGYLEIDQYKNYMKDLNSLQK